MQLLLKTNDLKITVDRPNWWLMADEATQKKNVKFYEAKNVMVDPTCELLNRWKLGGNKMVKFRCNDSGENKKLDKG